MPETPADLLRDNLSLRKIMSFEQLRKAALGPCGDRTLRQHVLAELLLRCWLASGVSDFRKHRLAPLLQECLARVDTPTETVAVLLDWLGKQSQGRNYALPQLEKVAQIQKACSYVQEDLHFWQESNGTIVFVPRTSSKTANVVLLPFEILPNSDGHGHIMRSMDHEPLPGLECGARRAVDIALSKGWVKKGRIPMVMLGTVDSEIAGTLSGESAGFPILTALYCLHHNHSPGPFSHGVSGVLAATLKVHVSAQHDSYDISKKLSYLRECGFKRIILPECGCRDKGTHWCSPKTELTAFLPKVLGINTANTAGVKRQEIERILADNERGMRYGNVAPRQALKELAPLVQSLTGRTDIAGRQYLAKATLLQATAECHLGNPEKSLVRVKAAIKHRGAVGDYFMGKALTTYAVLLIDMMKYGAAIAMCRRILALCPKISNPLERLDLSVSAYGTMGQARTFWGLIQPNQRKAGLQDLQTALNYALKYDLEKGDLDQAGEKNEPRERNYLFMWYAYHAPMSPAANTAFHRARATCEEDASSKDHLIRLRWLAAYRALLSGKTYPWAPFEHELPSPESRWVRNLSLKYRGALRAAAGDKQGAEKDFRNAVKLIKSNAKYPLLGFIGGTCDLEARRSLGKSFLTPPQANFCKTFAKKFRERFEPELVRRYVY